MSLVRLPYELTSYVVQHLDLADVRALSLTCKRFQFLLYEPRIARALLEGKAAGSLEARAAQVNKRYAAELRRLIKRREAVSSVSPYLVAIVAVAESWIYEHGVLCYIHDRQLRILDLHRAQSQEMVISIRKLLDEAIPESWTSRKYKFQLLYFAHDLASCVYTHAKPDQVSWLVVFNPRDHRLVTTRRLDSAFKIFVRNDDKFLYYGTHSELGPDGYRRWVIRAFDIGASAWLEQRLDLPDMVGSDIGSTVCFDIFDGFFYGLANQTGFEVEEVDWTSYYTCFRFPTNEFGFQCVEHAPRRLMWRRSHAEGPIDERWGLLSIFRDESTNLLRIVEARKEWPAGHSSARRTYYTTDVEFSDTGEKKHRDERSWSPPSDSEISQMANSSRKKHRTHMDAPRRDPHMVHLGDDGSKTLVLSLLSKCPVRSYHPASQTFVDLVNDPSASDPNEQRLRLRGGSRRLWTPGELEEQVRPSAAKRQKSHHTFEQDIRDVYKHEDVVFWPPDQNPSEPDPALAELFKILSPPGHFGNIDGTFDERSLLYTTGSMPGGLKPLVFISFDPSLYLEGTRPYPGASVSGSAPGPRDDASQANSQAQTCDDGSYEAKGKGKETGEATEPNTTCGLGGSAASGTTILDEPATGDEVAQWRAFERPMHADISVGYHFDL
ncbi:hypothetical protein B0T24DRAFT_261264 [Lasiosphaeria ovina]|uniref:F-box domain-containing protein n=1 Tax=Lasiosphaeria ovina TaxID=92902 RepID=A0AAE0KB94_9PEZI|nr:hypothetical protein B0T24DRAFT_261264 [Lasiosphaeria ovina]